MGEKDLPAVIVIGAQNSGPVRVQVLEEQLGRRGDAVAPLRPVLLRTLADVQERLTFRAQAFIKEGVMGFQPRPEDLDYPGKLERLPAEPAPEEAAAEHRPLIPAAAENGEAHDEQVRV